MKRNETANAKYDGHCWTSASSSVVPLRASVRGAFKSVESKVAAIAITASLKNVPSGRFLFGD